MIKYIFYGLSVLSIFSALMVVFSKNPVHSVLFLIGCFFTIAGHYILLNAQFLAAVHIIVYAGAIMVLFLFVIMMLNLNSDVEPHKPAYLKAAGVIAAGLLMLTLIGALKSSSTMIAGTDSNTQIGMIKNLGITLFRDFVMPFEISSILFLSAMIGAVMLGKKKLQ
jgi:NADH-quinone oxidoreductase subunit J